LDDVPRAGHFHLGRLATDHETRVGEQIPESLLPSCS
jgi:hypothetical protein